MIYYFIINKMINSLVFYFFFLKKNCEIFMIGLKCCCSLSLFPYTSVSSWCIKKSKNRQKKISKTRQKFQNPDDKKGVDRSSTVIARDGTEGRLFEGWLCLVKSQNVLHQISLSQKRTSLFCLFCFLLMILFAYEVMTRIW